MLEIILYVLLLISIFWLKNSVDNKAEVYINDFPSGNLLNCENKISSRFNGLAVPGTVRHANKAIILQCVDVLVQTNAAKSKRNESWSIDNIKSKAIT